MFFTFSHKIIFSDGYQAAQDDINDANAMIADVVAEERADAINKRKKEMSDKWELYTFYSNE